jgi:hypothetical protein
MLSQLLYSRNIMTSMCPISIKSQGGSVTNHNVALVSMMSPISPAIMMITHLCRGHYASCSRLARWKPCSAITTTGKKNMVDDSRSLSRIVSDRLSQWQLVKASV